MTRIAETFLRAVTSRLALFIAPVGSRAILATFSAYKMNHMHYSIAHYFLFEKIGQSTIPDLQTRVDTMGGEDGFATSETIPLVFLVFHSYASSYIAHFRLVPPAEHPSFRVKVAHGDGWWVEVLLGSPPVPFHLSFRRVFLMIGLPDAVVLGLTLRAITLLGWSLVTSGA